MVFSHASRTIRITDNRLHLNVSEIDVELAVSQTKYDLQQYYSSELNDKQTYSPYYVELGHDFMDTSSVALSNSVSNDFCNNNVMEKIQVIINNRSHKSKSLTFSKSSYDRNLIDCDEISTINMPNAQCINDNYTVLNKFYHVEKMPYFFS